MDAPIVQYVTTRDGYDIAYTVTGEGKPFVFIPTMVNHVQLQWLIQTSRLWLEAISERFKMVHYDGRGQGLSTRGLAEDFSMADCERDLETVLERMNLSRFVLLGVGDFAHIAIRYAAKHPERVEALILLNAAGSMEGTAITFMLEIARNNWDVFLHNVSPGISWTADQRHFYTEQFRQMASRPDVLLTMEAFARSDVGDLLPQISSPTLVIYARDYSYLTLEHVHGLTARIPGARLTLIDGANLFGDAGQGMKAIETFLATLPVPASAEAHYGPKSAVGLSARELEVLRLLVAGRSSREIGEALVLSIRTVERHIANIYVKTGTHGRAQVTAYALNEGMA